MCLNSENFELKLKAFFSLSHPLCVKRFNLDKSQALVARDLSTIDVPNLVSFIDGINILEQSLSHDGHVFLIKCNAYPDARPFTRICPLSDQCKLHRKGTMFIKKL